VEHHVGRERFLERGGEALDELVRQAANETDRIGDEVAPAVLGERSRGRVECLEEAVVDGDRRVGQRVQQRRLAGVRVPRQGDDRSLTAPARLPLRVTAPFELPQSTLQQGDPASRNSPVGLQLRLARTARPDAAAEALEVLPQPPHARKVVLELRELDLELPLGAHGMLREDVQDELCAIDDAQAECVLEPALLAGVEVVVDDERLRRGVLGGGHELGELAFADVGAHVRCRPMLHELPDRLDACRLQELA
jgi:hypothetical protein